MEVAAAEEAARFESERMDREIRQKREDAKEELKRRRPKKLSEVVVAGTVDAALAATAAAVESVAEGDDKNAKRLRDVAAWASAQRERLKVESERKAKHERLALFEADLRLLGLSLSQAAKLDDRALRRAFRTRSRQLHPDVRAQQPDGALEGVPSVYELNAAYEAVKELLK